MQTLRCVCGQGSLQADTDNYGNAYACPMKILWSSQLARRYFHISAFQRPSGIALPLLITSTLLTTSSIIPHSNATPHRNAPHKSTPHDANSSSGSASFGKRIHSKCALFVEGITCLTAEVPRWNKFGNLDFSKKLLRCSAERKCRRVWTHVRPNFLPPWPS